MGTHDCWSTWWIKLAPKNTIENIKHFKIQFSFNNPKNTVAVTSKNIGSGNSKPKNILRWSLSVNMASLFPGKRTVINEHWIRSVIGASWCVCLKLQLHDAIYRLRFYSNSLIHILSLSKSQNNVASLQKNRGDKSHRAFVAFVFSTSYLNIN